MKTNPWEERERQRYSDQIRKSYKYEMIRLGTSLVEFASRQLLTSPVTYRYRQRLIFSESILKTKFSSRAPTIFKEPKPSNTMRDFNRNATDVVVEHEENRYKDLDCDVRWEQELSQSVCILTLDGLNRFLHVNKVMLIVWFSFYCRPPRMSQIIDGKKISAEIRNELSAQIKQWMADGNRAPQLTAILIGEDPASSVYVNNKMKVSPVWVEFLREYALLARNSLNTNVKITTTIPINELYNFGFFWV